MNSVRYSCKICRRPGLAKYAPEFDASLICKWADLLTCNPCYDSRSDELKARDLIMNSATLCLSLGVNDKRRAQIVAGTKLLARVLCARLNLTPVWQQEFPDMLCERPGMAWNILKDYEKRLHGLRQESFNYYERQGGDKPTA